MNLRKDHCYDRFAPRILIVSLRVFPFEKEGAPEESDSSGGLVRRTHTHTHTKHNAKAIGAVSPEAASSKITKTLNNGYLGSRNDEERSEMRYVVRIAGCKRVIESLNAYCARGLGRGHVCLSVSRYPQLHLRVGLDLAVPALRPRGGGGSAEAQRRAPPLCPPGQSSVTPSR